LHSKKWVIEYGIRFCLVESCVQNHIKSEEDEDISTIYGMLALDGRHSSGYLCGYDKDRFNIEISPTMYPMRDQNMSNMKDNENIPVKVNQSHENNPIKVNQSQTSSWLCRRKK